MSEGELWARWWAMAWMQAHPDWYDAEFHALPIEQARTLTRSQHARTGRAFAITPCLPIEPDRALLHFILASATHQAFVLTLVDCICRPQLPNSLCTTQQLWCQRLSKVLRPTDWLATSDDTLQLLRAWVTPAVWQRLRLSFARSRVSALELITPHAIAPLKLQSLWQAVLWKSIKFNEAAAPSLIDEQEREDVVTTQD